VVREAHPTGIMASYNRINGLPAVANGPLLETWLRGQLGFDGCARRAVQVIEYPRVLQELTVAH